MADVTVRTPGGDERVALVELVNRVVDRGVVLSGELTISVAEIDLLYVGLRLLLCSADRVDRPPMEVGLPSVSRARAAPTSGLPPGREGAAS